MLVLLGLLRSPVLQANVRCSAYLAFSELARVQLLIDQQVGPLEPRVWVCLGFHLFNVFVLSRCPFHGRSVLSVGNQDLEEVIQTDSGVVLSLCNLRSRHFPPSVSHGCMGWRWWGALLCFPILQLQKPAHACVTPLLKPALETQSQKPSSAWLAGTSVLPNQGGEDKKKIFLGRQQQQGRTKTSNSMQTATWLNVTLSCAPYLSRKGPNFQPSAIFFCLGSDTANLQVWGGQQTMLSIWATEVLFLKIHRPDFIQLSAQKSFQKTEYPSLLCLWADPFSGPKMLSGPFSIYSVKQTFWANVTTGLLLLCSSIWTIWKSGFSEWSFRGEKEKNRVDLLFLFVHQWLCSWGLLMS